MLKGGFTLKTCKKPFKAKLSTIQAKADAAMSVYIRMKYADENGYVKCVSCGRSFHWKDVDCGHFISRGKVSTRWVEENAHPECPHDNRFNHTHLIGYTLYMVDMYGRDKIEELEQLARQVLSPTQKRKLAEEAFLYYSGLVKG